MEHKEQTGLVELMELQEQTELQGQTVQVVHRVLMGLVEQMVQTELAEQTVLTERQVLMEVI
jgi:hypothetical protein